MSGLRPPVGDSQGTPLKAFTPSTATLQILPALVLTTGVSAASAVRKARTTSRASPAVSTQRTRKARRLMSPKTNQTGIAYRYCFSRLVT
jgi:hypothetical protein